MYSLLLSIVVLVAVYYVQRQDPWLAGLVAIIPIKILATILITHETGGREYMLQAYHGILVGQWVLAAILLAFWLGIK